MFKDIFVGEWTDRRPEKFRQVNTAVKAIQETNPKEKIQVRSNELHEKAHIAGSKPGMTARIRASVKYDSNGKAITWRLTHEPHPCSVVSSRDLARSTLAPLFVRKWSHKTLPSDKDMLNALVGVPLIAVHDWLTKKHRR